MNIEYEVRVLNINEEEIKKEIEKLGGKKMISSLQRRKVYDLKPAVAGKWLRLRTNGQTTTLTIKNVQNRDKIDGTKELEIIVNDFDKTALLLEELGYHHKSYQENYRTVYKLKDVELDIDRWPLIPTYMEIEGPNEESIQKIINLLKIDSKNITTYDVESIYEDIYKIDIKKYDRLMLENNRK